MCNYIHTFLGARLSELLYVHRSTCTFIGAPVRSSEHLYVPWSSVRSSEHLYVNWITCTFIEAPLRSLEPCTFIGEPLRSSEHLYVTLSSVRSSEHLYVPRILSLIKSASLQMDQSDGLGIWQQRLAWTHYSLPIYLTIYIFIYVLISFNYLSAVLPFCFFLCLSFK